MFLFCLKNKIARLSSSNFPWELCWGEHQRAPPLCVESRICHSDIYLNIFIYWYNLFNPLSAIWRIYPSSKWSSQWPYDGYIRHGWMTSCRRGRGSATSECFGRGSQGTIFVRSSKLSLFFPELCSFRRVFCFPRFCKIWRQTFEPWGFWFRRCLGALFENCAPTLGIFLRTPTTTTSSFWKFLFFFQSRAGVTCRTAMVIPRLSNDSLVVVRPKIEWKRDFRALARSSAEGQSIVVAFSTSRLRWSMVQKRQKPDEVSRLWLPFIVYKNQRGNQRVLRSLFRRPDVSTVLLFAVFV